MKPLTQISGQYSYRNFALFRLKRLLENCGWHVPHPASYRLRLLDGRHVAFGDSNKFSDVEIDYYNCIRMSRIHFCANSAVNRPGRLGQSASLELCFAICFKKPVCLTRHVKTIDSPDAVVKRILRRNMRFFYRVEPTRAAARKALRNSAKVVRYLINTVERYAILEGVKAEITRIRHGEMPGCR